MSRGKELAKNTTIIFIGKFCTQLLSFLLLPLYTSLLNTAEYGIIDLILTYVSLIVPCITLELTSALFRFLVDKRGNEKEQSEIITIVFIIVTIITTCFCILVSLIASFLEFKYTFLCVLMIITATFSNLALQLLRGVGDYVSYSISSAVVGGLTVVFNVILLVVLKAGANGMLLSVSIANCFGAVFAFAKCKIWKYIRISSFNKQTTTTLLRYSIPLIPNSVIWWVINVSDRSIVTGLLGVAANGIYAISTKFPSIITTIYSVFNLSWQESVSLHINDDDGVEYVSNTFFKLLELFATLCVIMISSMWIVFPIMINNAYSDAYQFIPILVLGSFFNVLVGLIGAIYVGLKKTKEIAITSVLAGIINSTVNIFFVKQIGIFAAAISTLVAFFIMSIYRLISIRKYFSLIINKAITVRILAFFTIVFVFYYIDNIWINIISLIISVAYAVIANMDMIKKIINQKRI